MNDDNTSGTPGQASPGSSGSPRKRTVAVAAAVGVAGLVAGGVAAGAISAASASTDGAGGGRPGYGAPHGYGGPGGARGGDPSKPMRGDEKLLTGTTKTKVLAAVKAKYPDATVQRAETDSDGVYEVHLINAGKPLTVLVGKDFTITGTRTGPSGHGGPGRHGGPGGEGNGERPAPPNGVRPTPPSGSGSQGEESSSRTS